MTLNWRSVDVVACPNNMSQVCILTMNSPFRPEGGALYSPSYG